MLDKLNLGKLKQVSKTRYATAGVTIAAAAVTAHLMQSNDNSGAQANAASILPVASSGPQPVVEKDPVIVEVAAAEVATTETPKPALANALPMGVSAEPLSASAKSVPEPEQGEISETELLADIMPKTDAGLNDSAGAETLGEQMLAAADPADLSQQGAPRPPMDVVMPQSLPEVGQDLPNRMASSSDDVAPVAVDETQRNSFGLACGPILTASPSAAAGVVTLSMTAPCREMSRVDVRHGPIFFTAQTDEFGSLSVDIPVMMSAARFEILFEDGEFAEVEMDMPVADGLERIGIIAAAGSGFQVHALEFGADYDEAGHVWADAPRTPTQAELAGGGYLMRLGDASLPEAILAEIYTFPGFSSGQAGVVRLSVETEVTAANCGAEVSGQTVEFTEGGTPYVMSMSVAVPGCEAVGEYLVLKNLLRDLRIASN